MFSLAGEAFQKTLICDVEMTFVTTFAGVLNPPGGGGGGAGVLPPAVVALTGDDQFDSPPEELTAWTSKV